MLLFAAPVVLSGCGSASASAAANPTGPPKHGGTVIVGLDQEPSCINVTLVSCSMATAQMVAAPLWDSFIASDDKGQRYPLLATDIPTVANGQVKTVGSNMVVTMGIKPEAHWSDGVPITCEDFDFTWKTTMSNKWQIGSRIGWDKISKVDCADPHTIVATFSEPYAYYLAVLGSAPFPKHDLEGKDFNTYLNDAAPVTSGPFRMTSWKRGVEIDFTRNTDYWNKGVNDLPYLNALKFIFIKSTNTLKVQLRTGEVDWINPPPDTSLLDELKTYPRSKFQSVPGGYWENFAFQTQAKPMDNVDVRRAIAYAIDRKQLTDIVLRGQTSPLQSVLLPWQKDFFTPAWEQYTYSPDKVTEHLKAAGYTKSGTYWTKGGKPLEFTFKSTAGNSLREKVAQLLQQNFKQVGIKMDIAMELPQVFFGQTTIQGQYQTGEWAWSSSLDPRLTEMFACDQIPSKSNNNEGKNNYRWCNQEVTKLLHASDVEPDITKRGDLIKQAQVLMGNDVPLLPMYQRPETVAYANRLQNIKDNPLGGQFWNVAEWWVTQ